MEIHRRLHTKESQVREELEGESTSEKGERKRDQTLLLTGVLSEFADSQFGVCECKPVNNYKGKWANEPETRREHEPERHRWLKWKHGFSSRSWIKFLECICSWEPLPSERIWEDFWRWTCEGIAKGIRERASVWWDMKALCQVTFPPREYNTLKLHVNAWSLRGENSRPAARVSCSLPAYAQPTWILTCRFDALHSQISFLHQEPFKL